MSELADALEHERRARLTCALCAGHGCEESCGRFRGGCKDAHMGPDSHKVCNRCGGSGQASATGKGGSE